MSGKYLPHARNWFQIKQLGRLIKKVSLDELEKIWKETTATSKFEQLKKRILLNMLITARKDEAFAFAKMQKHPFELHQRIKALRDEDPCREILERIYLARIAKLQK